MVLKLFQSVPNNLIILTLISFFIFWEVSLPQSAQTYFPSATGYTWTYKVTPLDSINNPMNSLSYYRVDLFAVIQDYQGRSANYVLSKSGPSLTIPFQPYLDTAYLSFQNNDAYKYYRLFNFDSLLNGVGNKNINFAKTIQPNQISAFEGWFPYYKFAQSVNVNYQIFSKDTSLTIDSLTIPVRYELKGKRLNDQTITTGLGTFVCKKFLLTTVVSYLLLPILPIPLYQILDTSWIASDNWLVKQVIPSSVVNLSAIGLSTFFIPGNMKELVPALVTEIEEVIISLTGFYLFQNYPNPFNPNTKISWQSPVSGYVSLKVFDILGHEVATLVDEYKPAGSYEVEFQSTVGKSQLPNGIYFYTLRVDKFVQTKKMILIK